MSVAVVLIKQVNCFDNFALNVTLQENNTVKNKMFAIKHFYINFFLYNFLNKSILFPILRFALQI